MHKVVITGWDEQTSEKEVTICVEDDGEGNRTLHFKEFDVTLYEQDLQSAIKFLLPKRELTIK